MVVIGLTGGVGTGKSTVAAMFAQLGATVLDADVIAHHVMEPGQLAWRRIVKTFGDEVVNEDRTIDRRRLADMVFRDEERRRQLEAIIHPQVLRHLKRQVHQLRRRRGLPAVVLDIPLLYEAGMESLADVVVVVAAPPQIQRERVRAKHGWTDEAIEARMHAQWDLAAKAALADFVIENANGIDATRTQVKGLWNQLVPHSKHSKRSSTSRR